MNTLKSLSLLAVCVVAGVVLFTLKGADENRATVDTQMPTGKKLQVTPVVDTDFTLHLQLKDSNVDWVVITEKTSPNLIYKPLLKSTSTVGQNTSIKFIFDVKNTGETYITVAPAIDTSDTKTFYFNNADFKVGQPKMAF